MSTTYPEIAENVEEQAVFGALADPKWNYRTIAGIQRATGLDPEKILEIINKYQGDLIVKSSLSDLKGRDLYTPREKKSELQDFLSQVRTFASKSVR